MEVITDPGIQAAVIEYRQTNSVEEANALLNPPVQCDRFGRANTEYFKWIVVHPVMVRDGETIFTLGRIPMSVWRESRT